MSYAVTTVCSLLALSCGSLSLTALMISYSLIIPTIYGLIFLKDPVQPGFLPGIALLMTALWLINKNSEGVPITLKWIVYTFFAFFGNGMCSVVQKMEQIAFDGAYKNELMIMALMIVVISVGIISFITEGRNIKEYLKKGWLLGALCGIMNAILNLFVMILSGKMPASLMFPLISAGGIIVTYFIARFFYKENLSKKQLVGFALGTISVICLSI